MEQEYYKISQVAKILGVTRVTLYNWKNKGLVKFIKPFEGNSHNYITRIEFERLKSVNKIA